MKGTITVYQITAFAKRAGVGRETIRYYERRGLLPPTERTASGYRLYTEDDVRRVRFIRRMQALGFTLDEIHKLLGVVDRDDERCRDMYTFVVQKLDEVREKIAALERTEAMLRELKEACPHEEHMYTCPIIDLTLGVDREYMPVKRQ